MTNKIKKTVEETWDKTKDVAERAWDKTKDVFDGDDEVWHREDGERRYHEVPTTPDQRNVPHDYRKDVNGY